jgi:hypothetical protein
VTPKPRHPRQPLSIRLALARRDIARFAAFRQHVDEEQGGIRQHSKFSLVLLIALTAIGVVAAISAIQLLEAALR